MKKKLLGLASRIYLSPTEEVLEECSKFLEEVDEDINLLKSICTSNAHIHYSCRRISPNYEDLSKINFQSCENKHLIKSLIRDYAISDIKKPS